MKLLRNIRISQRIWLILIIALVSTLTAEGLSLSHLHKEIRQAEITKATHLVEVAHDLMAFYHQKELNGELTGEQARQQALAALAAVRYSGNEYYWVNDMNNIMIMHPLAPQTVGTDLTTMRNTEGVNVISEMVQLARSKGTASFEYSWPKPGEEDGSAKIAAFKHFKPWDYMIGTGIYVDAMQAKFRAALISSVILSAVVILAMFLLLFIIGRSISQPLDKIVNAMRDVASGEADLTRRLDDDAKDELSQIAYYFNRFNRNHRFISYYQRLANFHVRQFSGNGQSKCNIFQLLLCGFSAGQVSFLRKNI